MFKSKGHLILNANAKYKETESTAKTNGIQKLLFQNQVHQQKPQTDLPQNHKNSHTMKVKEQKDIKIQQD
jgi:hypothetical protein